MQRHPFAQVRQRHMAIHQQVEQDHRDQHQIAHHRQSHAAAYAQGCQYRRHGAVRQAISVFRQPGFEGLGIEFNGKSIAQQHRLYVDLEFI